MTEQAAELVSDDLPYGISPRQYQVLMRPLAKTRVAKRSQGGKNLSYLEAWDVKAHLTRVFGFGNWDSSVVEFSHVANREYMSNPSEAQKAQGKEPVHMIEVVYSARVNLNIRNEHGVHLCSHTEAAVGSTSGPLTMLGEHHDNAVKTAASDALKRCAINLGTQFGLSLYDDGSTMDVVKMTVVQPPGSEELAQQATEQQSQALATSLGTQVQAQQERQEQEAAQ